MLRRESAAADLPRGFAIYDDEDQLTAVKLAMTKLQIEDESLTPRNVLSRISHAKNHGQTSEQLRAEAFDQNGRRIADIFVGYEKLLHDSKALDFDDLLLRSARWLRESRRRGKSGKHASNTFTWTNIRTLIACNMSCCGC